MNMRPIKFILFALLLIFIIVTATFTINDPDTMNYLAVGKYIMEHGFPHTNVFSFTIPDYNMPIPEWLAEIVVYLVYAIGKWNAMVALQIALNLAIFLIIFKICREEKYNFFTIIACMTVAVIIATERFMLRSELFGLLCGVLMLYLLFRNRRTETKLIYLAIPIQLLWVNFHGSFPLGFILISAFIFAPIIKTIWQKYYENRQTEFFSKKTKTLVIVLLLCVLVSFFNHDGIQGFFWPFKMMTEDMKFLATQNLEFQSPFLEGETTKLALRTYKIFLFVSIIIFLLNGFKVQLIHLFLFIPFAYLSVQSLRHISLFAIFATTIIPPYLDNLWLNIKKTFPSFAQKWQKIDKNKYSQISAAIILSLIISYLIYQTATNKLYFSDQRSRRFGFGVSELVYPEAAVDFIKKNNISGNGFNDYSIGTYLNWQLWPLKKTFIDGHTFSPALFNYYQSVVSNPDVFKEAMEKYQINYALVDHSYTSNMTLVKRFYSDDKWMPIYFDELSIIFILKDKPENKELVEKYAIDFKNNKNFDPDHLIAIEKPVNFSTGWSFRGSFFANMGMMDKSASQFEKAVTANPKDYIAYYNLGTVNLGLNKTEDALKNYEKAIKLMPNYAPPHFGMASLYQQKNLLDEAVIEYKKALKLRRHYPNVHYNLGIIYEKKNISDMAKKEYQAELQINQNHTQAQNALSRLTQQQTPQQQSESVDDLQKSIEKNPNDTELHLRLGVAYGLKEQTEEAIDEFKKAIALDDSLVLAHFNLGNAYAIKNMLNEAVIEYKKTVEIKPNFAQAHLNLGVIFAYKLPNRAEAIKYWQKYVDLNPDDQQFKTIKQELEKMKQGDPSLSTTGE